MLKIGIVVMMVLLTSTAYGVMLNKRLNFKFNDFVTPIGFAFLIMLLQIGYYPAMFLNLSSNYEHFVSLIIFLIGIGYGMLHIRDIAREYCQKRTIVIGLAFAVFLVVFYLCYIDISFSDSQMYLNYMSQNINIDHENMFDLWTGQPGQEWDTIYLFQGYYHFGSFLAWLVNANYYLFNIGGFVDNIVIETWGLGMIYSVVSSMLIYNFANYFGKKQWVKNLMLWFGLFYLNFFYWRVAFSFYGNTYRTIYMCALLYFLYRYFKEKRIDFKCVCIVINFAGLAFSSSYLFISFSIMYALMVYTFYTKERNSIRDMADFVFPLLCYALACFSKDNVPLFAVGIVSASIYYLCRNHNWLIRITDVIEGFLHKYSLHIFVFGVAAVLAIGGAVYYFLINPGYEYNYVHYFENHANYDMMKDFSFRFTGKSQNLVNVLRWVGLFILLLNKPQNEGDRFLKYVMIILFVVFLSPLSVIGISKLIASNVYYRTFDVVFNPLTEMLFIGLILQKFDKKPVYYLLTIFVVYMIAYAHLGSYINHYTGEYGFYINRNVLPKYKISNDNLEVIRAFEADVKEHQDDDLRVVSHAEGLRTFVPNAWQIFTPYQIYYPDTRINAEFFEQARNHYPYETYYETDFSSACQYIERFDVDYVIVEWNQNMDYDIEVSKCMTKLYGNYTYHLYRNDNN